MVDFFKTKKQEKSRIRNWYEDRIGVVTLQRNFLLVFALSALFILAFCLFTLFAITKSKSVEPFVIEISKTSGVATLVNPVTVKEYSADRSLTNHFILSYIKAREAFNPATYQYDYYTTVRVFSDNEVYSSFKYFLRLSNPKSYLNVYSDVLKSRISVRSVKHLDDNSAIVRFTVEIEKRDNVMMKVNKVATLGFKYKSLDMNEGDRYVNPLGFMISSYQVENDYT